MKNFLILSLLLFFGISVAQKKATKKNGATTKTAISKETPSFLEKLMEKNIEDAALLLDEEFSQLGVTFTKSEDELDYIYDINLKKTDTINSYIKTLRTNENARFQLTADKEKRLTEFYIYGRGMSDSLSQKVIQKIGIKKWNLIETKGQNSVYRKGKYFAKLSSETPFSCEIFLPVSTPSVAKTDSLNIKSTFSQAVGFAQQLIGKAGSSLLAVKKRTVSNDSEYKFYSYSQEILYNQGTTVFLRMNDAKKISILIYNPNVVVFSALKNKLIDDSWKKRYTNTVMNATFFQKNEMMTKLYLDGNTLELYPLSINYDEPTRLQYGAFLSLAGLNEIYDGFSFEDRIAYMNDHYAPNTINKGSHILNDNNNLISYCFYDDKTFNDNYGLKFSVDSDNIEVNNSYRNSLGELPLASEDSKIDFNGTINKRTQFYNNAIFVANKASQAAKKNAQILANQREEAAQKQRDIEREQEKARKNEALTETINKTTNELMKLLQK